MTTLFDDPDIVRRQQTQQLVNAAGGPAHGSIGTGIGLGLARLFGRELPEVQAAQDKQEIMENILNSTGEDGNPIQFGTLEFYQNVSRKLATGGYLKEAYKVNEIISNMAASASEEKDKQLSREKTREDIDKLREETVNFWKPGSGGGVERRTVERGTPQWQALVDSPDWFQGQVPSELLKSETGIQSFINQNTNKRSDAVIGSPRWVTLTQDENEIATSTPSGADFKTDDDKEIKTRNWWQLLPNGEYVTDTTEQGSPKDKEYIKGSRWTQGKPPTSTKSKGGEGDEVLTFYNRRLDTYQQAMPGTREADILFNDPAYLNVPKPSVDKLKTEKAGEPKDAKNFWWVETNADGNTTIMEDAAVPGTPRYKELVNRPDAVAGKVPDHVRKNLEKPVPPNVWGGIPGTITGPEPTSTLGKEIQDKHRYIANMLIPGPDGKIVRNAQAINIIKSITEKEMENSGTGLSADMRKRLERNQQDSQRFLDWYTKITKPGPTQRVTNANGQIVEVPGPSIIDMMYEGRGAAGITSTITGLGENLRSLLRESDLPTAPIDAILSGTEDKQTRARLTQVIQNMTATAYARAVVGAEYRAGGEGALSPGSIKIAERDLLGSKNTDTKDGWNMALTIATSKIQEIKEKAALERARPLRQANERSIRDYAANNGLTISLKKYPPKIGNNKTPKLKQGVKVYVLNHPNGAEYAIDGDLDSFVDTYKWLYSGGGL